MEKKLIFVCSPYRGLKPYSTDKYKINVERAKKYSLYVFMAGHIPITPHLYFEPILKDDVESEKKMGIEAGMELLKKCNEVWVFGQEISEGMKKEIDLSKKLSIPLKCKTEIS